MVYLYYISCLRYTILVGNPRYHCRDIPFWSETLAASASSTRVPVSMDCHGSSVSVSTGCHCHCQHVPLPPSAMGCHGTTVSACMVCHCGTEWEDRLAITSDITSGLWLGRAEVLRGLRNFLNMDRPESHSIDRLKERGMEKGTSRYSTLQGPERSAFNQTNIGEFPGQPRGDC